MNVGIGVKAFIVKDGKLLMIRRRANDPHNPGKWDLPGGRIKMGEESPQDGLKRETAEEAGLDIEILMPLDVQFFTRQDGQVINLIFFLCKPLSGEIRLSEEHQEYQWFELIPDSSEYPSWLKPVIENYFRFGFDKFV